MAREKRRRAMPVVRAPGPRPRSARPAHARSEQRTAPQRAGRPIVAIVGRPNVGKSALFNRLTRTRLAIVEDRPGVTRDRLYADASAFGRDYVLIDTGGFDPDSEDPLKQSIASQVPRRALRSRRRDLLARRHDAAAARRPRSRQAACARPSCPCCTSRTRSTIPRSRSPRRSCTGSASTRCTRSRRCTATASAISSKRCATCCPRANTRGRSRRRALAAHRDRRPPERR